MAKLNSKASSQSADNSANKKKSSASLIDKDPFYKHTIIKLRDVLELHAELVVYHMFPTSLSLFFVIFFRYFFHQKFYHIQMNVYGSVEFYVVFAACNIWTIAYIKYSRQELIWAQVIMTNAITIFFHFLTTIFVMLWILTPGTNFILKMDFFVLIFILWNYFGLGMAAIAFPIPIWGRNIFVVIFSAIMASFVWVMFSSIHLLIIVLYQAVWDLFFTYASSNNLQPEKKGMCFSHAIVFKISKKSSNSSQNSKDSKILGKSDENLAKYKSKNTPTLPQSTPNVFKLRLRTQTAEYNRELKNGLPINKHYGSDAMFQLKTRCETMAKQGSHISLNTLVFYVIILIYAFSRRDFVASFFIGIMIGFIHLVKCMLILFAGVRIPTKLIVLFFSFTVIQVVNYMVSPCFKHIVFARIESTEVMHSKFQN